MYVKSTTVCTCTAKKRLFGRAGWAMPGTADDEQTPLTDQVKLCVIPSGDVLDPEIVASLLPAMPPRTQQQLAESIGGSVMVLFIIAWVLGLTHFVTLRSMKPPIHPIAACVLATLATACSPAATPPAETGPRPRATAETAELEALYRARTDSARMRFTDADVRFMTGMIGHHAQALVMAALSPTHGANPAVQILSARPALLTMGSSRASTK